MFYFFPFLLLVLFSLKKNRKLSFLEQFLIFIFLVIFIGFRVEIGTDWQTYSNYATDAQFLSFDQILNRFNVLGYSAVLYLVGITKTGIIGLNFLMSIFFSIGLIYFCNKLENPFLALICAYPYLIVTVSMGFITQAAALGPALVGYISYERRNYIRFYISILGAFLFHSSAPILVLVPIFDSLTKIRKKSTIYFLFFIGIVSFYFFWEFLVEILMRYELFFRTKYQASSAYITSGIALVISLIFLIKRKLFKFNDSKKYLIISLSLIVISLFIFTLFTSSTTASYRVGLYFYPLQIYVLTSLPYTRIFNLSFKNWKILIIIYNFLLLYFWLNFANHSVNWIPYRNLLFFPF